MYKIYAGWSWKSSQEMSDIYDLDSRWEINKFPKNLLNHSLIEAQTDKVNYTSDAQ